MVDPSHSQRTLAAALLNAGRTGLRSSVRGDPRGPVCGMGTCFECRATVGDRENVRTCLESDARLGDMDTDPTPRVTRGHALATRALHSKDCDVLVVGAGPAGLAAACAAAQRGKSVLLIDENAHAGGQIWRSDDSSRPAAWRARARSLGVVPVFGASVALVTSATSARIATRTDDLDVTFRSVVLATGSTELYLPFPGWTLPNVFGLGGLQALVKGGLDVHKKRIALAGSGPLLLAVAASLSQRGARVVMVAEQARWKSVISLGASLWTSPRRLVQAAGLRASAWRSTHRTGCWPARAEGDERLRTLVLQDGTTETSVDCDYAGVGFGLVPHTRLGALLGCQLRARAIVVDREQRTSVHHVFAAGECTGIGGVDKAELEGTVAGAAASGDSSAVHSNAAQLARERAFAQRLARAFALRSELKAMSSASTLVCRCEDVERGAVERCTSWREAKLHTRCGMGPCQGRVCGPAVEFLIGFETSDARPPVGQVPLAALVGADERGPHNATSS